MRVWMSYVRLCGWYISVPYGAAGYVDDGPALGVQGDAVVLKTGFDEVRKLAINIYFLHLTQTDHQLIYDRRLDIYT